MFRELQLMEKKEAYKKQLVQQLREEREYQLQLEKEAKEKEKELLKLSLMQRMKNNEVNAEFNEKMRNMKIESMRNNRALWDKQCVSSDFECTSRIVLCSYTYCRDILFMQRIVFVIMLFQPFV